MRNLDPNYGDNTICDCCGRVFDVRNTTHDTLGDKWICGDCLANHDEEELRERLLN
jgi:hypothetical protein